MTANKYLIGLWFVYVWIALAPVGLAAPQFETVTVVFSAFSGPTVPLWIADQDRLGKKYGLDMKAVYLGRAAPQQLLFAGEASFVVESGAGTLSSHVFGIKDQVIISMLMKNVPGGIFSKTAFKSADELKGRTIGTARPGGLNDVLLRYVLRAKLGLLPDRDVKLFPVGEPAIALQALERGDIDAASLIVPAALIARKMGFRELVNYDRIGAPYPYSVLITLRQTLSKNPELAEKVSKTMIEGIFTFKTNKEKTLAVMRKYMRGVAEDILEETYQYTRARLEEVPNPSLPVIKSALEMVSLQYPNAKEADPSLIIDPSFVRRIDQSGFIGALYRK